MDEVDASLCGGDVPQNDDEWDKLRQLCSPEHAFIVCQSGVLHRLAAALRLIVSQAVEQQQTPPQQTSMQQQQDKEIVQLLRTLRNASTLGSEAVDILLNLAIPDTCCAVLEHQAHVQDAGEQHAEAVLIAFQSAYWLHPSRQ